ncbi:tetraacyldisaccharide 4'-kinase [Pseudodesulfovibrio sp. zrk46]|uniref:tetraacyldisaccharide 4'-kinase n=1 Tax=Pseudodesulfovibrio sp. zrk46 TaxID=2725288 RepID=UPI001449C67A|nr:tetraacyldisaccharide 4'-kinase [Pseudodesulfovibrio sp. zrk46]QJB56682.1 tetraacyldisaccharide 4'-kinase [Pseudodesulfovibrio sp. zrk46]
MADVTALQKVLAPILKPASWVYAGAMRVREQFYKRGFLPSWEPEAVTVSVGNIGWGGSGKTPIAGWLLDWAANRNMEAMLLTRGYKAKPVSYPYYVQPGALAEEAGDEPLMLATQHPKAHVIVDPVRTRGGRMGMKQFNPELVVLDDGFQHMAVKRHLNLVLLRPEDLSSQWKNVIPAGSWREPVSALKRADAFMMKVGPKNFQRVLPFYRELLGHLHKPLFSFQVLPTGVRNVLSGEPAVDFDQERYLLVTGVGDPKLVERTATHFIGYKPQHHMIFRDHHAYSKNDVMDMHATAAKLGCKAILCTPKDAVKLGPMCTDQFWEFDLRVEFGPSSIGRNSRFNTWWTRQFDIIDKHVPGYDPHYALAEDTDGKEDT